MLQIKKSTVEPLSKMSIKKRFDTTSTGNTEYAPFSLGSPSMTLSIDYNIFRKTDKEKAQIATAKRLHNEFLFNIFGTKRPTAGRLKKYYLS